MWPFVRDVFTDYALRHLKARLWPMDFSHVYAFETENDGNLLHIMDFLSVKSVDSQKIISHLQIENSKQSFWSPRLIDASKERNKIFVSEPQNEWVFIMSPSLSDQYLTYNSKLKSLSENFGEACYFYYGSNSMVLKWSRAVKGKISRSYLDNSRDEEAKEKYNAFLIKSFFYNEQVEDNSNIVCAEGTPTDTEKKFKQYGEDTLGDPLNVQEMMKIWVFKNKNFSANPKGYSGIINKTTW